MRSTPTPKDCLRTVKVSRDAGALALDHDALEDLDARARALDHLEVHADGVARLEPRQALAQLTLLDRLDGVMAKSVPRKRSPAAGPTDNASETAQPARRQLAEPDSFGGQ